MNLDNITKAKIMFGLNLLSGLNVDGYKFISYNANTDELVFSNGSNDFKLTTKDLNKTEIINNEDINSDTSNLDTDQQVKKLLLSETSEDNSLITSGIKLDKLPTKIHGDNKNVFKSSKYSDTSSPRQTEISNYSTTSDMQMFDKSIQNTIGGSKNVFKSSKYSDTSSSRQTEISNYSNTSDMQMSDKSIQNMMGGSKNVFKSSKYSDTSSARPNELSNYSNTSDIQSQSFNKSLPNMMGGNKNVLKTSKYSDTSSAKFNDSFNESINNSNTLSNIFNSENNIYSETSNLGQFGGNFETSDTFKSISDLQERKSNSNLDIGIFKKIQSGGFKNETDIKKKMLNLGINSNTSSTSSICE